MTEMSRAIHRIFILLTVVMGAVWMIHAQEEPPVVLSGDRTIIYIDRLPLRGDESLMDVLLMYPEPLVTGFDRMLDDYQLRMENVVMSCNIRQFLASTMARACVKIQICENPGVMKGKTGLGGVIDLSMRRNAENLHGAVTLEAATSTTGSPALTMLYGRTDSAGYSTDMYVHTSASFYYPRRELDIDQYADIHLHQRFGLRDRLLVYLRQSYDRQTDVSSKQDYLARARYFHTFNAIGTELMLLAGYEYGDDGYHQAYGSLERANRTRTGTQLYVVEMNTPLPFVKGLQLGGGWEMNLANHRYHLAQDMLASPTPFDASDRYTVMNNDLYLQLDYTIGPVKLSIGDRVSFYNYSSRTYTGKASCRDTRNFIMASIAATPATGHQLQAGYYRRFINPSYLLVLPTSYPVQDGVNWLSPTDPAQERKADVVRLAYTFTHKRLNLNVGTKYIRMIEENTHTIQANAAASWMTDWLILTGGATICHTIDSSHSAPYGSVRLSPTFRLSEQWRIAGQVIWFSSNAPERVLADAAVYGLVEIEKRFDDVFRLSLQWHDPFSRNLSAVVVGGRVWF